MKVRLLRNLGEGWPPLKVGEIVDVSSAIGEALLGQNLAELMPIQAVPPAPAVPISIPKAEPAAAQESKGTARKNKDK